MCNGPHISSQFFVFLFVQAEYALLNQRCFSVCSGFFSFVCFVYFCAVLVSFFFPPYSCGGLFCIYMQR